MLKIHILDMPCGITVLGSQMQDDSTQCRLVGRSAHMFQKAKKKKKKKKKRKKTTPKTKRIKTTKQ